MKKCALKLRVIAMPKLHDISGQRFGRLTVLERVRLNGEMTWKCRCDCGNITYQQYHFLHTGKVKSCGCYSKDVARKQMTRHGDYKTRLYSIYLNMKNRCRNKSNKEWKCYVGKGIKVCDEWANDYLKFKDWALSHGYNDNLTIDRIDNDKGYSPENCRWADRKTQDTNKSNNVKITINGVTKTLSEWSELSGINQMTLSHRLNAGWSKQDFLAPVGKIPNYQKYKEDA